MKRKPLFSEKEDKQLATQQPQKYWDIKPPKKSASPKANQPSHGFFETLPLAFPSVVVRKEPKSTTIKPIIKPRPARPIPITLILNCLAAVIALLLVSAMRPTPQVATPGKGGSGSNFSSVSAPRGTTGVKPANQTTPVTSPPATTSPGNTSTAPASNSTTGRGSSGGTNSTATPPAGSGGSSSSSPPPAPSGGGSGSLDPCIGVAPLPRYCVGVTPNPLPPPPSLPQTPAPSIPKLP